MATGTLGTNATTSLTSFMFSGNMNPQDLAAINAAIKGDNNPANNTNPQTTGAIGLKTSGMLHLPGGRGNIFLKPGDYIAVDPNTGWPIVISANCAANGAITHT